ncbi:MAG: hypothetical protein WC573_12775, partial [Brevundimonas sp.]|uniref:hypothetical protein n=1 Tax=Brevundimonas sp. TaxID=1871086 RepID=UPI0035649C10|nr:hypothetical protein [Alphaproteobacteria bacterium]
MSDRESIHIQALELRFEGADFSSEADQRLVRDVLAMVNDGIEAATVALVRHPELARHPMSVSFLQSWLSPLKQRSLSLAVQKSFLVVVGGVTVIVRRRNIWRRFGVALTESGPRQGLAFRRRACGAASGDVRWSVS